MTRMALYAAMIAWVFVLMSTSVAALTPMESRKSGGSIGTKPIGLSDALSHYPVKYSPPRTWVPGSVGFPAQGQSYTDPVFGAVITRITSGYPGASGSINYAKNGLWNADSTYTLHYHRDVGIEILNIPSGTVARSIPWSPNPVITADSSFDPINPDLLWSVFENKLVTTRISDGVQTTAKTFAFTVGPLGSSVDWIDATGRYFVVMNGSVAHVWDRVADVLFTGAPTVSRGSGWVGISPQARKLIVAGNGVMTSYPLDRSARTIGAGVMFWSLAGDHADVADASDGGTYVLAADVAMADVYVIDTSLPQAAGDPAQQRTQNRKVADLPTTLYGDHVSAASRGVNRDWIFYSSETSDDTFADPGAWAPYKQEIFAVQVVSPFTVRRLAHHRSRSITTSYYAEPRIQANWDGTQVIFSSNFGANPVVDYSDLWSIEVGNLTGD